MNTGNIPTQLIIVLIFLAFSGASWLYRVLRERRQVKLAEDARRRQRDEALRTGRDPDAATLSPLAGAPARRDLAQQRAEALRELRRQAEARAGRPLPQPNAAPSLPRSSPQPASAAPAGTREVELWPGGPRVVIADASAQPGRQPGGRPANQPAGRAPTNPRPAQARPAPQRPAQPAPRSPAPARADRRRDELLSAPPRREPLDQPALVTSSTRAPRAAPVPSVATPEPRAFREAAPGIQDARRDDTPARLRPITGVPRTRAEWRAAIIAGEVLGRPLTLREPA